MSISQSGSDDLPDGMPGNHFMSKIPSCAIVTDDLSGTRCTSSIISCRFVTDHFYPQSAVNRFVKYLCQCRGRNAFYELCSAFDIPENVRIKITTNNSSTIIQCFDALHSAYHHDNELTLVTIKMKLSEYSHELQQVVCDYPYK